MLEQQQSCPRHIGSQCQGLALHRALGIVLRRQRLDFVVEGFDWGRCRINRDTLGALGRPKPLERGGHRALQ